MSILKDQTLLKLTILKKINPKKIYFKIFKEIYNITNIKNASKLYCIIQKNWQLFDKFLNYINSIKEGSSWNYCLGK